MLRIRKSDERGHVQRGWLDARHTFSFGGYFDPDHMGFRHLRVLNEDVIAPGAGFPEHGHRDMEILTYIVSGSLEHRDDAGGGSVIRAGDVQRMSAGRGVLHSEANPSPDEPVHLLQIWIHPSGSGIDPGYEEQSFPPEARRDRLCLVASRDAREGSLRVQQDVSVYATLLSAGRELGLELAPGRHAWVQLVRGELEAGGVSMEAGDGLAVSGERALELLAREDCEALIFDLA